MFDNLDNYLWGVMVFTAAALTIIGTLSIMAQFWPFSFYLVSIIMMPYLTVKIFRLITKPFKEEDKIRE